MYNEGKKQMKRVLFFIFLATSFFSSAQSTYPELMTLPRASERIKMESKNESNDNYKNFMPIATASFITLMSGVYAEVHKSDGFPPSPGSNQSVTTPDDISRNAQLLDIWGLAWIGASYWMIKSYTPYTSAVKEIGAMPAGTPGEQVIRERLSEERIAAAKRTGQYMNWSFAIGNFALCNNLISKSGSNNNGVSQASSLCSLGSVLPLVFNTTWALVHDSQMDYKKRIYGPIASAVFTPNEKGSLDPGVAVSWRF